MLSNASCAIFNIYIWLSSLTSPCLLSFITLILILGELFSICTVYCVHPSHCNYMTLLHQMFIYFWIKHSPPHSVLIFCLLSQKVNKYNRTGKIVLPCIVYEYKVFLLTWQAVCLFHERISVFKVWTSLKYNTNIMNCTQDKEGIWRNTEFCKT